VTVRFDYDPGLDPPGPVLPVRVSAPGLAGGMLVPALVDSGADISVVPESVAAAIGLPAIGEVSVQAVGHDSRKTLLFAAEVEVAGASAVIEVIAVGEDALLGRNLLNRRVLTLHGPRRYVEVDGGAE